jgi:phenylalanyl-tRNA synthetase beta chain
MVEDLLEKLCVTDWDIAATSTETAYHPGRCAVLSIDGKTLGIIGEIHPKVTENYGMNCRVFSFTLDVDLLFQNAHTEKTYQPLPKFPAVTRDLALICNDKTPVRALEQAIRTGAGALLEKIELFDVYRGEQIEKGKKSVAFRVTLRSPESTLTEEQITKAMKQAIQELENIGAVLRSS